MGIGALGPPSLGHAVSTATLHWDRTQGPRQVDSGGDGAGPVKISMIEETIKLVWVGWVRYPNPKDSQAAKPSLRRVGIRARE